MARSRIALLGTFAGLLGACTPAPIPALAVVAPTPQSYTCEQSHKASAEFDALPASAQLRVYVTDYGILRRQLRVLLGLQDPPKCPPVPIG